jgi:hypothetical protein
MPFGPVPAVPAPTTAAVPPTMAIAPGVWGMGCQASLTTMATAAPQTTSCGVHDHRASECDDTTLPISLMQSTSANGGQWQHPYEYARSTVPNTYGVGNWPVAHGGWPVSDASSCGGAGTLGLSIAQGFACQGAGGGNQQQPCLGGAR